MQSPESMQNNNSSFYPLTVNQALALGRRMITYPCIFLILCLPLTIIFLAPGSYPILLSPMIFLLSLAIAALYRAYAVPKWRIRAFSSVRNVHQLQRRAEFAMLIPGDLNPGLKRFEIWSADQKQLWAELQLRFNQADEFKDQPEIPAESKVYYSVWIRLFYLLLSIVSIGFGLLLILMPGENPTSWSALWGYIFGTGIIIGMGYFAYHSIRQMLNRKPQIIISDSGIDTSLDGFRSWGEMIDVRIISRGTGRYQSFHLVYHVNGRSMDLELDGLNKGRKKLDQLIRLYRGRYMQHTGSRGSAGIQSPIRYFL